MGKTYRLLSRVKAVGPDWVELERPLTANASLDWAPRLHAYAPQANGCGVEHLTIRFKWAPYGGHLKVCGQRFCVLFCCCCVCCAVCCVLRARHHHTNAHTQKNKKTMQEAGFNAIHFNQLSNSWVRNVRVENADAGVYFWGTQHCTVTDFEMAFDKKRATEECNCGNQNGHRCVCCGCFFCESRVCVCV